MKKLFLLILLTLKGFAVSISPVNLEIEMKKGQGYYTLSNDANSKKVIAISIKSREMDLDSSIPKEKEKVDYRQLIEPNSIVVNLEIPSEIFFQMISEGLLENFDLESIMGGEFNNEDWTPTKEPDDPDYGKDWQDWSPDPEDYV